MARGVPESMERPRFRRVAIIGYSFRFPNSTPSQFWDDLVAGSDLISRVSQDRWNQDVFLHPDRRHPGTAVTFAAGSLGDVSGFDGEFFGISPREAAQMDPQQRLLLEMSWEALENSGVRPSVLRGSRTGVFIGIASTDYIYRLIEDLAACDATTIPGNAPSIAANRISYVFDLHGPSMAIDTACSSALVAFHQACRSILSGEIPMALTGGINLHLHPFSFVGFSKASMLSAQGRCRVFDASGDGYVRSEGGGIFVLKDYERAVEENDPILAVVSATGVNTDGHKSGLTVPSADIQAELLRDTYAAAGFSPDEIDYLEAHGTGTAVGDPVEARAIGEALGRFRSKQQPLRIGSVKSNLGHLEAASGVAGLVKVLLCLRHRLVPGTIGIQQVNPNIPLRALNLEIVKENLLLKPKGRLVVGVNSFGFGGANAHVVLESHEAPTFPGTVESGVCLPVLISGRSAEALKSAARRWVEWLHEVAPSSWPAIAYASLLRRDWHRHRAMTFARSSSDLADQLREWLSGGGAADSQRLAIGTALDHPVGPIFVYAGNGSQWAGMGRKLLGDPVFLEAVRDVDRYFRPLAGFSLERELAGDNGSGDRYAETEIAQPALFALQVGITSMLRQLNVEPAAVVGHSVGEVAAAWACGALSLKTATAVMFHRSCAQGKTKGMGQMRAVAVGPEEMLQLIDEKHWSNHLCVAAINSPCRVTVSGATPVLEQMERLLDQRGVAWRRLDFEYAFHSPVMDGIREELKSSLQDVQPQAETVLFYSTVTGTQCKGTHLNGVYWWDNVRQPVQFGKAIIRMGEEFGANLFLEIGPQPVLRSYIKDCLKSADREGQIIPTVMRDDDGPWRVNRAAALSMLAGGKADWTRHFSQPQPFVSLPNYPWQRERHWHATTPESQGILVRRKVHPLLGYPLAQHTLTWENCIDARTHPFLAHHKVGEAVVFPGAAFVELALAAAQAWQPSDILEIENLEIHSPLVLNGDHSTLLRIAVDPADGRWSVQARVYTGAEDWTRHATGGGKPHPSKVSLKRCDLMIPSRVPDFVGEDHYAGTHSAGLSYGPAFQSITHGWFEHDTVWAALRTDPPASLDLEGALLPPPLLDGAFQLVVELLRADRHADQGVAFVPTRFGRIRYQVTKYRPAFARAVLVERYSNSLIAEFDLFAADGSLVATIEEASFRRVCVLPDRRKQIHHLVERLVPSMPVNKSEASSSPSMDGLRASIRRVLDSEETSSCFRRYSEEIEPLLDVLCNRFVREAFNGILNKDGGWTSLSRTLLSTYLVRQGVEGGTLVKEGEDWRMGVPEGLPIPALTVWNTLISDHPEYAPLINAIGRVGIRLSSLLRGEASATDVCPSVGSFPHVLDDAVGAEGRWGIAKGLHAIIDESLGDLPKGQRLRLLQVSHVGSRWARVICEVLDFDRCDYMFASPVGEALESFDEVRAQYPLTRACSFDEHNSVDGRFDLAILDQDCHEETAILAGLERAAQRLASGGMVVLLGFHPAPWMDFLFAAHDTWLQDRGEHLPNTPLRPAGYWADRLSALGFNQPDLIECAPGTASGAYFLCAKKKESAKPEMLHTTRSNGGGRAWLIVADPEGLSAELGRRLVAKLDAQNDHVTAIPMPVHRGEQLSDCPTLREVEKSGFDGVMLLAGLPVLPEETGPEIALDDQVDRCSDVARLVRWSDSLKVPCWIVTMGAMDGSTDTFRTGTGVEGALWGFGRVLQNECPGAPIRLVDLHPDIDVETALTALVGELDRPDGETEVIRSRNGERYVVRLRERRISVKDAEGLEDPVVRLGFEFAGQLAGLHWETHAERPLSDEEVEIEVKATGLNFRDVMYAQGLLPETAIAKGFAGVSLGLECSGIVRRIGSVVRHVSPGDAVLGFAPACFSNRVVTMGRAVAPIPAGLSFEEAATIPTAFFTAYYALTYLARLGPGESILIHGAAGGVGIAAIQIAQWIGAEIHATAGSEAKRDFLRMLGVHQIYDSRSLEFADALLVNTGGRGVDVVLNSLAGEAIRRNLQVLKPFGRFLELGKRDFYEDTHIGLRPFRNNISYFGIDADMLMQANPSLTQRLFAELLSLFERQALHPLPYRVYEHTQVIEAFRHMQQSRHIGKVVVAYRGGLSESAAKDRPQDKRVALTSDATYLVTGGLSGFGLKTAERLVKRGARHLVLISKSGTRSDEANAVIEGFSRQGVKVLGTACDVTDVKAVDRLCEEIRASWPPLQGIIHAAAVIDDALIERLTKEQMRRVLAPKILGALHLHRATEKDPLDFFVLYSSATVLFGNPGQAAYVAANQYLSSLARARRQGGLAATCVRWGAIEDAGFLARNENIKHAFHQRMGCSGLHSSDALDRLEMLMLGDRHEEAILAYDWATMCSWLPTASVPKYLELTSSMGERSQGMGQAQNVQQLLQGMDGGAQLEFLVGLIKEVLSDVLRISRDKIEADRSLHEMGLDSLMSAELVVGMSERFGTNIPVMVMSNSPTVVRMAKQILDHLERGQQTGQHEQDVAQIAQVAAQHGADANSDVFVQLTRDLEAGRLSTDAPAIHRSRV